MLSVEDRRSHLLAGVERLGQTEATYVTHLLALVNDYLKPLRSKSASLGLSPGELAEIFANAEQLYSVHEVRFLRRLVRWRSAAARRARPSRPRIAPKRTAAASRFFLRSPRRYGALRPLCVIDPAYTVHCSAV